MRSTIVSHGAALARRCTKHPCTVARSYSMARTARTTHTSSTSKPKDASPPCGKKLVGRVKVSADRATPSWNETITLAVPSYPREIVFLGGAPGSGKGTNSSHVSRLRNFTAKPIVVSDLLNTPACRFLKDHGIMVDDDFVFKALLSELQKPIYRNGVVVDGFPRTSAQVELLTKFDNDQRTSHSIISSPPRILFVMLHVDETASIARQLERGRKIQLLNKTQESLGEPLFEVRQTDIDIKASQARYLVFKEQFEAVMSLGQKFPLVTVDASAGVDVVQFSLTKQLASLPTPL